MKYKSGTRVNRKNQSHGLLNGLKRTLVPEGDFPNIFPAEDLGIVIPNCDIEEANRASVAFIVLRALFASRKRPPLYTPG